MRKEATVKLSRWRGMTETEYCKLSQALRERAKIRADEERRLFQAPDEADRSIAGALYWSIRVLGHDYPGFLVVSSIATLWVIVDALLGIFGTSLIRLIFGS